MITADTLRALYVQNGLRQIDRANGHAATSIRRDARPGPIVSKASYRSVRAGYIHRGKLYSDAAHRYCLGKVDRAASGRTRAQSAPAKPRIITSYNPEARLPSIVPAFALAPKFYPGKPKTMAAGGVA